MVPGPAALAPYGEAGMTSACAHQMGAVLWQRNPRFFLTVAIVRRVSTVRCFLRGAVSAFESSAFESSAFESSAVDSGEARKTGELAENSKSSVKQYV